MKKLAAYSVVPELLVDQKFFQPSLGPELSYAGYENGRLVYNEGDFDYVNQLSAQQLLDPRLYSSGLSVKGFHHLAVRGPQNRTAVVTTATYSVADWLANFSFLFLLHTFFSLVCIGVTCWPGADTSRLSAPTSAPRFSCFSTLAFSCPWW
ncbi:hypothetical protein [Hymenobacter cellulosilyticus]|uniref:Uncharacterized protein n=1 Tax=Hymenobacter cellulosilyticus TaxID=2932248 RepID=A0A8T9QAY6_9BACT|nr:hypothetical protein [Hymenobacter cellulosilyticus]UOQ72033.1 hypothetical protein MUN79_26205 [Hymenobacter cellulosilyticus]